MDSLIFINFTLDMYSVCLFYTVVFLHICVELVLHNWMEQVIFLCLSYRWYFRFSMAIVQI